jgi:aerobic carbon-monoxide dehydrogenase medium subunit
MATTTIVPTTADEAAELYGDGDGITVFAGGTMLMAALAAGYVKPQRTLLLHRCGLDQIRADGDVVRMGAMVTLASLADGDDGLLARFAGEIADPEVRATASVGGNLCAPAAGGGQRGDLGAPLIALGARVRSTGAGGERTEPVEDFLAANRKGRLLLEIEYDRPSGTWAAESMRRRHAHSYALANVAICSAGGELRVGVSAVAPTAVRCRTVEQSRSPEDVLRDVEPVSDAVASAGYRRKMLPVLVGRALAGLESR